MAIIFSELLKGAKKKLEKVFKRELSKFDISWWQEKKLKHSNAGKIQTHVYKGKYRILFTDPRSFLHTVNELFIDEIYKFETSNKTPYIIDCGAYIGTSILYFKTNYPTAKILAFEPDEDNFEILSKNVNSWSFDNVEVINKAIWENNEPINFESKGEMSGSIQTDASQSSKNNLVKTQRLFDLLDVKIDLLKIDIEGAEYEVIKDCDSKLKNVEKLFIEYHSNYDQLHKLNLILNILLKNNFYYYIKEAGATYKWPFYEKQTIYSFDVQLNIFAFRR
jgi:FkbM family methyltransferase